MRIKLLDVASRNLIDGQLLIANLKDMKDHIHDKWHFNWKRHFSLPNSKAFKIVTISKPEQIEGLMIFQMLQKSVPYMAYLESAPGNVGNGKKIDRIAGCLIAKACQLSFIEGKDRSEEHT